MDILKIRNYYNLLTHLPSLSVSLSSERASFLLPPYFYTIGVKVHVPSPPDKL